MRFELQLERHADTQWLETLRWVNAGHYFTKLGDGALRKECRVTGNGRFLCHLIPSVLTPHHRREFFRLLLAVARNKATGTRRLKNVGGGEYTLTRAGTPSLYARARRLKALRDAREGVFGFEGIGRGSGCRPCAFNWERPEDYRLLVSLCDFLADLARHHEPEISRKQMDVVSGHRDLMIGNSGWSQGVGNLSFPMTAHRDRGNVRGSISAMIVVGDFENGPLIFPAYSVGVFVQPGDLLLFDGRELHGVGPFTGVRLSGVLYLKRDLLHCPCTDSRQLS